MIRAAIVGIGWWGRMLVNAVQGKSAAIRFTAGYTRTRATAEGFCAEHRIALANDLDALLADPAMTATGVHSVDLLIRLFGPIDEVYCLSQ